MGFSDLFWNLMGLVAIEFNFWENAKPRTEDKGQFLHLNIFFNV